MKLRFAEPKRLIDVNRIGGLDGIEERDGSLRIGALVRHHQLVTSEVITARLPDDRGRGADDLRSDRAQPRDDRRLARARRPVRRPRVGDARARGDGRRPEQATASARSRRRTWPPGPFQSSIGPTELLTEVRVPAPGAATLAATYLKLERKVGDFATVAVAISLTSRERISSVEPASD